MDRRDDWIRRMGEQRYDAIVGRAKSLTQRFAGVSPDKIAEQLAEEFPWEIGPLGSIWTEMFNSMGATAEKGGPS